ncbi:MAG: hypothetical protein HYU28_06120 [Actinobacteria bacterium]|nr:hypothetical protein [Actinomycetota bacterium]
MIPRRFVPTREALHAVATHVVAPARYRTTGRIGMRWTPGGFGTPLFGEREQVRVCEDRLIVERGGEQAETPLTTLRAAAAAAFDGPPDLTWARDLDLHDPPEPWDFDAPLDVDEEAARFLGEWFGLAWSVLGQLRAEPASVDASEVQLWPEHFDAALECGSDADRRRASLGFSPGDGALPQPYAYVSLWYPDDAPESPAWNATSFRGAVLPWSEFEGDSQAVLEWLRERRDLLANRLP